MSLSAIGVIGDVCTRKREEQDKGGDSSSLPGNQGSSPQSSQHNRGARGHSRETQWAGVREGAVGIGMKGMEERGGRME